MVDATKQNVEKSLFVFVKDTNTGEVRRVAVPSDFQVGVTGKPGETQLTGRLALNNVQYTLSAPYVIGSTAVVHAQFHDTIISLRKQTGITGLGNVGAKVYLPPSPREGQVVFVKDVDGYVDDRYIDIYDPSGALIDNSDDYARITMNQGSIGFYWSGGYWRTLTSLVDTSGFAPNWPTYVTATDQSTPLPGSRRLAAGSGVGIVDNGAGSTIVISATGTGGGGADPGANYVILGLTSSLPNERALTAGTGISIVDGGAGSSVTISVAGGVTGADPGANYVILGLTSSLPNERALTAGAGISIVDGGAGSSVTISSIVRESADVSASYITVGNTGSLPNERALTAGTGISILDNGANSTIVISATGGGGGADVSASYVTIGNTGSLPNERALTAGAGISIVDNGADSTVVISATGGTSAADVSASYVIIGNTGSLPNERALTAGAGIDITDNGAGSTIVISATGGGSGADVSASYVTIGNTGSLPNERALTAGAGISIVDNGADSTVVISATGGTSAADVSASYITVGNTGSLPNERALTAGTGISILDNGAGSTIVISATGTPSSGSSLPLISNITILAGMQEAKQTLFQDVAAFEFNPTGPETMAPSGSTSWTAYFQPIIEIFPTGTIAETRLFNITSNEVVPNSLLTGSSLTPTRLRTQNLTGSLATGSNVYTMQMRILVAATDHKAFCKGAKLFVTWN